MREKLLIKASELLKVLFPRLVSASCLWLIGEPKLPKNLKEKQGNFID